MVTAPKGKRQPRFLSLSTLIQLLKTFCLEHLQRTKSHWEALGHTENDGATRGQRGSPLGNLLGYPGGCHKRDQGFLAS